MATKSDTIIITVPKEYPKQPDLFVSINAETYMIKRGVPVEVPRSVYAVIAESEERRMAYLERAAL